MVPDTVNVTVLWLPQVRLTGEPGLLVSDSVMTGLAGAEDEVAVTGGVVVGGLVVGVVPPPPPGFVPPPGFPPPAGVVVVGVAGGVVVGVAVVGVGDTGVDEPVPGVDDPEPLVVPPPEDDDPPLPATFVEAVVLFPDSASVVEVIAIAAMTPMLAPAMAIRLRRASADSSVAVNPPPAAPATPPSSSNSSA